MKKIAVTITLLTNLIAVAIAQPNFNKTFQLDTQTYFPKTEFYDVSEDGKFIYVFGDYQDYQPTPAPYDATSFILTLDQNGNELHRTTFKPWLSWSSFVPISNDGFALITDNNADSLFLLKVYPLSDTVITIGQPMTNAPLNCHFGRITTTSDKHFLVIGSIYSPSPNSGSGEYYMKMDSLGNIIWQHQNMYYYPNRRWSANLQELKNGNYLMIGNRQYKSDGFSTYERQAYFKILDTSGTVLSTTYTDNNRLLSLGKGISHDNGNITFVGSEIDQYPFGLSSYRSQYRGYVCQYDSLGNLLWDYSLDNYYDWAFDIYGLADGSCIVTGKKYQIFPDTATAITSDSLKSKGLLLKLASDGTKVWEREFSIFDNIPYTNRRFYAMTQASNGDFISVGMIKNTTAPLARYQGWIIRTDSFGCIVPGCQLVNDTKTQTFDRINQLTVFPNPTSNWITFQFENPLKNSSIRVFNSLGQEITTQQIIDNEEYIDCSNWQNGMYFYGIYQNNQLVKQGQFLKQ